MASRRRRGKKVSNKEEVEAEDTKERAAALATIEVLSNKYLTTKSLNDSGQHYGIIRGDSFHHSDSSSEEGDGIEKKKINCGRTTKTTMQSRKTRHRPGKNASISSNNSSENSSSNTSSNTSQTSISKTKLSEERFRVPHPILGGSTPTVLDNKPKRDSLFGFGDLDSPLTFSPIKSMELSPYNDVQEKSSSPPPHPPKRQLIGMYDLVPAARPTKRKKTKKKLTQRTAEMEKWAKEMNAMFADIEKDELHWS